MHEAWCLYKGFWYFYAGQRDGGRNVAIFPVIPCIDSNLDGECCVPCLRQG